jgi:hypothetical protein
VHVLKFLKTLDGEVLKAQSMNLAKDNSLAVIIKAAKVGSCGCVLHCSYSMPYA